MAKSILKNLALFIACFVFLILTLTSCGSIDVTWLDSDGTVLYAESVPQNETIPLKKLPLDNDQWHYTEWRQVVLGKNNVTFWAERVEKSHVVWLDANENILYEEYVLEDDIPAKPLPQDTDKWHYTNWAETHKDNEYTYVAERELREDYFVGNVFQIVVKDLAGTPLGTGTGFVFDKTGWFITNAHVMEEAYQAVAIFEIRDSATGESFTTLEIKNGSYVHNDKDIFIGKLEGYSKIVSHYKNIAFQSNHSVGDITYSVGYPNSSVSMEIHKGEIENDLSSLYDKLYSGISYIASSSYIAPGSSGGILINEDAEVIGMTTLGWFDDNDNFKLGAAIEAYNYTNLTSNIKNSNLQDMAFLLHPDEKTFIRFFRDFVSWPNTKKVVFDDLVYYQHKWEEGINSGGNDYTYEEVLIVFPYGFVSHTSDYYWDNGDHREFSFYGFYSSQDELDNFSYEFKYTFGNGNWYSLESDNINYSENLNLTLRDYTQASSYGYTASSGNIEYAKEQFNIIYEWLYEIIEKHK